MSGYNWRIMTNTGEQIRQARLKAGFTQSQLARVVDTSERNVARWEAGTEPRLETLTRIAEATGKPLEFFLQAADPANPSSAVAA